MPLLTIARVPPITVSHDTSVLEAVKLMEERRVGAVSVLKEDKLCGVFTERDLLKRVVLLERDPKTTVIGDVMTTSVISVHSDMSQGEALRLMVEKHFRHLPVVDDELHVLGMLSLRHLLRNRIEDLTTQLDSVVNYFAADGIGG